MKERDFSSEFRFLMSRSSGPGGQNVNKVNSKVELHFNIQDSVLLTEDEKNLLMIKLKRKINAEGELCLVCQSERSQLKNKEKVIEKFYVIIDKALQVVAERRQTKRTRASKEKRLLSKKINSERKSDRKPVDF